MQEDEANERAESSKLVCQISHFYDRRCWNETTCCPPKASSG